jgi:uncharacterized protein (DUF1684 family)
MLAALAGCLIGGCSKEPVSEAELPGDAALVERMEKDAAFKSDPGSPIPDEDLERFNGLDYYPVDPDLSYQVRLHRHAQPQSVRLATNTGEIRRGRRYGYFEFEVQGRTCRLQVYRMEGAVAVDGGAALFIPFRDATSGGETYPAGRYIDLIENTTGLYRLDFNRAYNPWCAYNGRYSCPLPPDENILDVPIRAGEKKYPLSDS